MISKLHKFPMRSQFFSWQKKAKLARSAHLMLYFAPSSDHLCAVVIPKKVNKLATKRNSFRRFLLDALLPLAIAQKVDMVLFVKLQGSKEVLLSELNQLGTTIHV